MTDSEQKVLQCLADAWNEFIKLPVMHPDDNIEFRSSIHNLQRIVGIRKLRRESDDWYNELEKDKF
jgi:hypothetical protein